MGSDEVSTPSSTDPATSSNQRPLVSSSVYQAFLDDEFVFSRHLARQQRAQEHFHAQLLAARQSAALAAPATPRTPTTGPCHGDPGAVPRPSLSRSQSVSFIPQVTTSVSASAHQVVTPRTPVTTPSTEDTNPLQGGGAQTSSVSSTPPAGACSPSTSNISARLKALRISVPMARSKSTQNTPVSTPVSVLQSDGSANNTPNGPSSNSCTPSSISFTSPQSEASAPQTPTDAAISGNSIRMDPRAATLAQIQVRYDRSLEYY